MYSMRLWPILCEPTQADNYEAIPWRRDTSEVSTRMLTGQSDKIGILAASQFSGVSNLKIESFNDVNKQEHIHILPTR